MKLISWTGWTKEDWKYYIENALGIFGLVASFAVWFL